MAAITTTNWHVTEYRQHGSLAGASVSPAPGSFPARAGLVNGLDHPAQLPNRAETSELFDEV